MTPIGLVIPVLKLRDWFHCQRFIRDSVFYILYLDMWVVPEVNKDWSPSTARARPTANYSGQANFSPAHNCIDVGAFQSLLSFFSSVAAMSFCTFLPNLTRVGKMKELGESKREQSTITQLKLGHTTLNKTLQIMEKHPCDGIETVLHTTTVLLTEKRQLNGTVQKGSKGVFSLKLTLNNIKRKLYNCSKNKGNAKIIYSRCQLRNCSS